MDITICENLKEFRKNKGNTQEELAEFIGISIQAVSKWERNESYPDITLLPKIAAYYNVSVDDLLGVGKIRENEKVSEYRKRAIKAFMDAPKNGMKSINASLDVFKEALREFPNNLTLLCDYIQHLPIEQAEEKIKLAERIIRESGEKEALNISIATQVLCHTYRDLGDIEKAKEYAKKLPNFVCTSNETLRTLLKGEEAVEEAQNNIMTLTALIEMNVQSLFLEGNYTDEEKVHMYKYCAKLYELLFEGGEMGSYHIHPILQYERISRVYARMNDLEKTVENLALLCEHTVKLIQSGDKKASSLLTNHSRHQFSLGNPFEFYAEYFINNLNDEVFDFCREDERIKEMKKILKKYIN